MRLLIVEDQQKHLEDAMATVLRLQKAFELQVRYASTLETAMEQLDWAEVVVTDLFFPGKSGESPDPPPETPEYEERIRFAEAHMSGVKLAKRCLVFEKPVVVCTSTYHHGSRTQPACDWMREHKMELVDNDPDPDQGRDGEALAKKWSEAMLLAIMLHRKPVVPYMDHYMDLDEYFYLGKLGREVDPALQEVIRLYDSIPKDA